uniref:Uncharacterized protein n=1 Tax=Oryza sativa subsp. japonica TaxID=39947 RepID=Q6YXJ3_ORYSJ|nr:hypothetical protein [Oryza sativa Japonica Group]BAD31478.1 hypothetical protein [Oryza sativa Japonica Group]
MSKLVQLACTAPAIGQAYANFRCVNTEPTFLRRIRAINHLPPLLSFLDVDGSFVPAEPPHPYAAAATRDIVDFTCPFFLSSLISGTTAISSTVVSSSPATLRAHEDRRRAPSGGPWQPCVRRRGGRCSPNQVVVVCMFQLVDL